MAGACCAWSPSCQAEGSLLGRGEHQGTTLGPCMAHTPPIRVTVAGLLLTLAGYSHAGAPAAALVTVAGCGMQRQDRCAGACGTSRPVIQKDRFVLLKRKKNKWEKKKCRDWRVWVLGTEDDITCHAVSFLLGTEEEKHPPLSQGELM